MPRQKNCHANNEHYKKNNSQDDDDNGDNDTQEEGSKAERLTAIQDSMIKDIIAAAGKEEEEEEEADDNEMIEDETTVYFVQSIYGDTRTGTEMAANFGNLIMLTNNNKNEWPTLLQAVFANLVMKHQEKGSTTTDQKFKGLNSQWFGPLIVKDSLKENIADNRIKQGVAVTIEGYPEKCFVILAVFSKRYNKWYMCKDTPGWKKGQKKYAAFQFSICELSRNASLSLYWFAEITPTNGNTVAYQLILLSQITSIFAALY